MTSPRNILHIFAVATLSVLFCGQSFAQSKDSVERTVRTKDGWQIHITYYAAKGGKDSPVVILVPSAEGPEDSSSRTRKVWDGVASTLHKKGFAVVTADLRKHGDSIPMTESPNPMALKMGSNDYLLMATQDLEAIKSFLVEEHQKEKLNIRKLGIAAAGSSCMVAAAFSLNDWMKKPWPDASLMALRTPKGQDVRAILMLSPKSPVRGLNTNKIVRSVAEPTRGIAINVYYNPTDRVEKKAADTLAKMIKIRNSDDEDARKVIEGPPDKKFTAEGFLQDKAKTVMENNISEFFDKYVKQREDPWKSRTSRLQQ